MAIRNRTELKEFFETFDKPTESQFSDLIDSMIVRGDSFFLDSLLPFSGNQFETPLTTTGNEASTGISLQNVPAQNTRIDVFVNGEKVKVGNGIKTLDCYFSRDNGVTALMFNQLQFGDILYWNGLISHIGDLVNTDDDVSINFSYRVPLIFNVGVLETTQVTGSNITFESEKIYNDWNNPSGSNITQNLQNAKLGKRQRIYHLSNAVPTFPGTWVRIGSGAYVTGTLNIIEAVFVGGTRVEYTINQTN
jgi:hypothetical protein